MKIKFTDEYKDFKRKIMARFLAALLMAAGIVWLFYLLVWYQRGGNWVVSVLTWFGMDEHAAFLFYHMYVRGNKEVWFVAAILLVLIILIRFLFVWLIGYLDHINSGIDKLLLDDNEPLVLLPEMKPMEDKLNMVKHTLWQRKQESMLAEKRKNELVMYLAHDIRTPLTSVIGYLNLLKEPDISEEQKAKYTEISLDKAYRLEKMINEFFEITRYNSRQMELRKVPIDLSYMLVQIIDEYMPVLTSHGNKVLLDAGEDLSVCGDPEKLARVFQNLLKNAASYSYPDTDMKVTAEEENGVVKVIFENRGKTIPESQIETLFRKFSRLDEARKSDTGGAGLGLAIAKEIVLLHGGDIEARSVDETIWFIVTLPKKG